MFEERLVDRQYYSRAKILSLPQKRERLERIEQQLRMGQEQRKKTSQREFMNELLGHARELLDLWKKNRVLVRKRAMNVRQLLESREKKKQQQEDREEKKRIQELKTEKLESYLELIKTTKNSRLLEILDQTHKFLASLGAKVQVQKQEAAMLSRASKPH